MLTVKQIARGDGEFDADEMEYDNRYLACHFNGQLFLYAQIQTHPDVDYALFHLTHKAWNHNVLKSMRTILNAYIRPALRDQGVKYMMGVTDGRVKNWCKLMRALGLDPRELPDGRYAVVEEV